MGYDKIGTSLKTGSINGLLLWYWKRFWPHDQDGCHARKWYDPFEIVFSRTRRSMALGLGFSTF